MIQAALSGAACFIWKTVIEYEKYDTQERRQFMAKILDKLLPSAADKVLKLYRKYDWLMIEYNSIDELYEEKKNKYCLCIPIINEKENIRLELPPQLKIAGMPKENGGKVCQ